MNIFDLGRIDYDECAELQGKLAAEVAAGRAEEALLLLEHPPVYTVGRRGAAASILDPAVRTVAVNRGGDVTWHGPGQLVGYPVVDLGRRGRDLHHYLRFLEEVVIAVAADYGVAAWRVPGRTGVWTTRGKLASIGVGVRRWVTMHGFALNVANDLAPFSRISPCGIVDCPVTTLAQLCRRPVGLEDVKRSVAGIFEQLVDDWLPSSADAANDKQQPAAAPPDQ
ncbi:octanoyltransferase [Geotalea uraniireducens]|uniref:Octanoyltransferase n=1 Tax=Geotalea uraniireducens TaxID=351604 RepID=A0ABM8EN00_9BACT|nr:lipoyl(octanoyl) transferase LipB [Geotalea uraniireducens]BDV43834.1 octanoyltransferase [Geotalea uraniireducens]